MNRRKVQKTVLAGLFCAIAVVGSLFSVPVLGSKCAPIQHMINILCAVLLGPLWAVGTAFLASLLRNMLGLGTILAFPGSMIGALFCGLVYRWTRSFWLTALAEVIGTGIVGGLIAYPVALLLMGKPAGQMAFYVYVMPFLISTVGGSFVALVGLISLQQIGILDHMTRFIHQE